MSITLAISVTEKTWRFSSSLVSFASLHNACRTKSKRKTNTKGTHTHSVSLSADLNYHQQMCEICSNRWPDRNDINGYLRISFLKAKQKKRKRNSNGLSNTCHKYRLDRTHAVARTPINFLHCIGSRQRFMLRTKYEMKMHRPNVTSQIARCVASFSQKTDEVCTSSLVESYTDRKCFQNKNIMKLSHESAPAFISEFSLNVTHFSHSLHSFTYQSIFSRL